MKDKKKIMIIGIVVLMVLIVGTTFAYFMVQGNGGASRATTVTTSTTDSLVFEIGKSLSIEADQKTFAQGKGNQTDSTIATATLKANSATNSVTEHYYMYLNIEKNELKYTTTEKKAELILSVNKVEGENKTPLTSIVGLKSVTVGDVSGFDITDVTGLIKIIENYEITSTGTKVDEWEVSVTLVNLDSDQSANAGATFKANLIIQKDKKKEPVLLANKIISTYGTDENLEFFDENGTNIFKDNSYRYKGSLYFHENLICFGSNEEECPIDNLYHILGVFDGKVQLVKYKSIGPMAWDTLGNNNWKTSSLNTYLNNDFLKSLGQIQEKISFYDWKFGQVDELAGFFNNAEYYYNIESNFTNFYNAKVGLLNLSDIYDKISDNGYNTNWLVDEYGTLYNFETEWFLASSDNNTAISFYTSQCSGGECYANFQKSLTTENYKVRPTFYLNADVIYARGDGTKENPYRIA